MATVEDFLNQLQDLGTQVDSVDLLLSEIGSQIVNDITTRAPVDVEEVSVELVMFCIILTSRLEEFNCMSSGPVAEGLD